MYILYYLIMNHDIILNKYQYNDKETNNHVIIGILGWVFELGSAFFISRYDECVEEAL